MLLIGIIGALALLVLSARYKWLRLPAALLIGLCAYKAGERHRQ